jgi:hypothetical protein
MFLNTVPWIPGAPNTFLKLRGTHHAILGGPGLRLPTPAQTEIMK